MIKPVNAKSLKDLFVKQFEGNILSGYFPAGEKLPSERDLASQMGVSRPVVHEGLVDLATKGLITMKPRHGAIVNDYRREGALGLLKAMLQLGNEDVAEDLLTSLLDMRMLFEVETARLASLNATPENVIELFRIVEAEKTISKKENIKITELDFDFHHAIAMASGNVIYPLMLNSMKQFYTHLSGLFFKDQQVIPVVIEFHEAIATAIKHKKDKKAAAIMKEMLIHGEKHLRSQIKQIKTDKGARS